MDSFLDQILAGESSEITIQKNNINLALMTHSGKDPLEILNPSEHSIAYLAIINARLAIPTDKLFNHLIKFANDFQLDPNETAVAEIEKLGGIALCLPAYHDKLLVPLVQIAIRFSDLKDGFYFNNLIPITFMISLYAKQFKPVFELLSKEIDHYSAKRFNTTAKDFLLYRYYGGLIYLKQRDFRRAQEYLATCFYVHSMALSAIQLEAYKKLILLDLILDGTVHDLPIQLHGRIQKKLKSLASNYCDYGKMCGVFNFIKMEQLYGEYKEEFESDGNLGLAKLCLHAMVRFRIIKWTRTYLALSVEDIKSMLGAVLNISLEETIHEMIKKKQIHAEIKDGMIHFLDDPNSYENKETRELINRELRNVEKTSNLVMLMEQSLTTNSLYQNTKRSTFESPLLD